VQAPPESPDEASAPENDPDLEGFNFFPDGKGVDSGTLRFPSPSPPEAAIGGGSPAAAWEPLDGHDDLRTGWPFRELLGARAVATVFGVVALIEAVFLIDQVMRPAQPLVVGASTVPVMISSSDPGDVVVVDGRPVGLTPFRIDVNASTQSIGIQRSQTAQTTPAPPTPPPAKLDPRAASVPTPARPAQRSGSLRLSSPIDVQVVEGDTAIGWSTDERPIVFAPGVHQLDLVNAALGYRARQTVVITSGETVTLTVTPPNGLISINAQPWAQVWIDGKQIGETPLANVPVPIGEHEIIFRHPQLGEKRQKARVSAGTPMRLTARMGS
jgi:hypothetical protein